MFAGLARRVSLPARAYARARYTRSAGVLPNPLRRAPTSILRARLRTLVHCREMALDDKSQEGHDCELYILQQEQETSCQGRQYRNGCNAFWAVPWRRALGRLRLEAGSENFLVVFYGYTVVSQVLCTRSTSTEAEALCTSRACASVSVIARHSTGRTL